MTSEISDPTIRLHNANCRGDCGKPSGCFVWGGVWMEDRIAVEASMRREMDSVADERDEALDRADRAESARSEAERERDKLLAALWEIKMAAERSSVKDPVWMLPNQIVHLAEGAMGRQRNRAQSLAPHDRALSPENEA